MDEQQREAVRAIVRDQGAYAVFSCILDVAAELFGPERAVEKAHEHFLLEAGFWVTRK